MRRLQVAAVAFVDQMNEEPASLDVPAPPGYTQLVPFSRDHFRGLGRRRRAPFAFASELNSMLVMAAEFFHAGRHYPIVFGREGASGAYLPVIVTGLDDRQNLLVNSEGQWRSDSYLPAYARRWPFFTVQMKEEPNRSLVCVDPLGLEKNDKPFINAAGVATSLWQDTERMINEMDAAQRNTRTLMQALTELELIESFEAHAMARRGGSLRFGNMFRVSEQRLNKLPEKQVKQLMTKGFLSRIYAHLMSLENFQRLLDLRLERDEHMGEA